MELDKYESRYTNIVSDKSDYKIKSPVFSDRLDILNLLFSSFSQIISHKKFMRIKRALGNDELFKSFLYLKREIPKIREEYEKCTTKLAGKKFYLNDGVKNILNHFVMGTKDKWDFVMLVTGIEGSAKTTLAKCIGYYMTKTYNPRNPFTNDNIVFMPEQFIEAVDRLPPGSCIIWDEFVLGGLSTDMNKIQNTIIKKFTMIRKKQLFIILVIPYIWMLRTYFAVGRTKLLINVYSPDMIKRGFYKVWGMEKKKKLYFMGTTPQYKWSHKSVQPTLSCKFLRDIAQPNFFTDDAEYERKKDEATKSVSYGEGTRGSVGVSSETGEIIQSESNIHKTGRTCPRCLSKGSIMFVKDIHKWKCNVCDFNTDKMRRLKMRKILAK